MENVETILIAKFVEPFRSQGDKGYLPVTYYGATNGRVFAIFPKPEHHSDTLYYILVDCTGLFFLIERKEVYILKERWRQLENLEQELRCYSRNALHILKRTNTHEEAENYLNSMLHPIEIVS